MRGFAVKFGKFGKLGTAFALNIRCLYALHQWFLTFFTYRTLLSNKITQDVPPMRSMLLIC